MSQIPPPPPGAGGSEPWSEPQPQAEAYYGKPPTSKAAVAGLVSSLVVCIPVLSPLLGLVLGIVGILNTRGGRLGGRGLAIAAVVIAVVGAGLQGVVGVGSYYGYRVLRDGMQLAEDSIAPLRASVTRLEEFAPKAYALSSARFQQKVSQEQFNEWLKEVLGKHGQLQSFAPGQPPIEKSDSPDTLTLHLLGKFLNGTAAIDFKIAIGGDRVEFDDIRVEGDSPLPDDGGGMP
jgi:hypothetical protein